MGAYQKSFSLLFMLPSFLIRFKAGSATTTACQSLLTTYVAFLSRGCAKVTPTSTQTPFHLNHSSLTRVKAKGARSIDRSISIAAILSRLRCAEKERKREREKERSKSDSLVCPRSGQIEGPAQILRSRSVNVILSLGLLSTLVRCVSCVEMTTSSPAHWGAHVVMRALAPKPEREPSNKDTSTAPVDPATVIPAPAAQLTAATTMPPDKKLLARTPRAMKKCTIPDCESLARSRGRCKAHGGGKRCNELGCKLSDQGGGFCIRHGGGRRCEVDGCVKSAQSRRFCKAHGGGVRCKVDGCAKTSQGGGCCRAHGSGPRPKKKKAMGERDSINGGKVDSAHAASPSSSTRQRPVSESNEPPSQTKSPLAFRIHAASATRQASALHRTLPPQFPGNTKSSNSDVAPTQPQLSLASSSMSSVWCRINGCGNAVPASNASQLCEEHGTNLHFAASLLGMLSTESA